MKLSYKAADLPRPNPPGAIGANTHMPTTAKRLFPGQPHLQFSWLMARFYLKHLSPGWNDRNGPKDYTPSWQDGRQS